ncbi:MAG: type II secretion system F family protein [Bdellovibrionales bacterium]|nr:type II secretion system F family protein [Bdellovibrionales bacterium]
MTLIVAFYMGIWPVYRQMGQLENFIEQGRLHAVSESLQDHFVFVSSQQLMHLIKGASLFLIIVFCWSGHPIIVIAGVLTAILLPNSFMYLVAKARKKKFIVQFHQWIPSIYSMIRSGQSIEQALLISCSKCVPPLSQELELMFKQIRVGVSFQKSLEAMVQRYKHPDLDLFSTGILLSIKTGAPLAELMETSIELIKKRKAFHQKLDSITSQCRIQARIGITMPILLALGFFVFNREHFNPLLNSTYGVPIVLGSLLAMLIGMLWIRALSKIKVSW